MSERPRYAIYLTVKDLYRCDGWTMAVDSDEFPIFSERFVEELRTPMEVGFSAISFDAIVSALKEREFRRDLLLHAARKLAERLADYIEDAEGWHGESRRDTIKEQRKVRP